METSAAKKETSNINTTCVDSALGLGLDPHGAAFGLNPKHIIESSWKGKKYYMWHAIFLKKSRLSNANMFLISTVKATKIFRHL